MSPSPSFACVRPDHSRRHGHHEFPSHISLAHCLWSEVNGGDGVQQECQGNASLQIASTFHTETVQKRPTSLKDDCRRKQQYAQTE